MALLELFGIKGPTLLVDSLQPIPEEFANLPELTNFDPGEDPDLMRLYVGDLLANAGLDPDEMVSFVQNMFYLNGGKFSRFTQGATFSTSIGRDWGKIMRIQRFFGEGNLPDVRIQSSEHNPSDIPWSFAHFEETVEIFDTRRNRPSSLRRKLECYIPALRPTKISITGQKIPAFLDTKLEAVPVLTDQDLLGIALNTLNFYDQVSQTTSLAQR